MTRTEFYIKLKTKERNLELRNGLNCDISLKELKQKIAEFTNIPESKIKVFSGYPRKQLNFSLSESLEENGIKCGDTLFVEENEDEPENKRNHVVHQPIAGSSNSDFKHIIEENDRPGIKGILLKKEVPADNSCLFSSLEFVLTGKINQFTSSHMRQLVADCIANQPDTYNDAILGKPVKEYCDWIRNTTSWGGAIELAVLSDHFGFEIAVVNSATGVISRFGEDKGYDKRVFLLFDGIHYDPLYMDFTIVDKIQTVFPTADETVLRDAEQLAIEAKESRQYTDVNQFMVCCTVCNTILVGQTEAQTHAKETGHTSFKEVLG